jgi:guanosine-3',5'-bis(diphosphate) 3'-pyrophosphohydrolase
MSPGGRWVEVQIRSKRMDEIAEMGLAAHYRTRMNEEHTYALGQLAEPHPRSAGGPGSNALDFVNDFKLNLFSDEIVVFTPNGEMRNLPVRCHRTGLRLRHPLPDRPPVHRRQGEPQAGALEPAAAQRRPDRDHHQQKATAEGGLAQLCGHRQGAHKIKQALREQKRKLAVVGREAVQRQLRTWGAKVDDQHGGTGGAPPQQDHHGPVLPGRTGKHVDLGHMGTPTGARTDDWPSQRIGAEDEQTIGRGRGRDPGEKRRCLVIGDDLQKIDYQLSTCCNPIAGDDVFGFISGMKGSRSTA